MDRERRRMQLPAEENPVIDGLLNGCLMSIALWALIGTFVVLAMG